METTLNKTSQAITLLGAKKDPLEEGAQCLT
jgi:hypothetical protein